MASKRDKILKTAERLVQKGKLDQAISEYEKLLEANPNDSNTVNRLGDLYGRVGEVDKAVALYERVAHQFADQGFIPKAIAIYKKINRLAPQRLDIFERLGGLYVEQGLIVEAKSQFQMLAEHYLRNEDVEGAIRVREQLDTIDPDDTSSRLKFADLLLEAGEVERATASYIDLGETLIRRERLEEAERLYRRLLSHSLSDGEVMAPICDRLLDAGNVKSAQELLAAGLQASPDSIPLRTLQVRAYMTLGETDSAVTLAREVLEIDPENPDVRGLVGGVLLSDGDEEQATEMMIPAAEALLEQADYSRAQKMLQELVEVAPDDERVLRLAIRAFRPSGDQQMLTRLTASLAGICFEKGQSDQARRFYMELVASDPTNKLFRERLAQLDGVDVGAPDNAVTSGAPVDTEEEELPSEIDFVLDEDVEEIDETVVESGPQESPSIDLTERLNEAAVFAKYGLHEKAIAHLKEVIRLEPGHLEARTELAKQYAAVGKHTRATEAIQPVIEHYREAGDPRAEELESTYGSAAPTPAADDDDVIIVDFDDDAEVVIEEPPPERPREPVAKSRFRDFGTDAASIDEMVARAMGDLGRAVGAPPKPKKKPPPDELLGPAVVSTPVAEQEPVAVPDLVPDAEPEPVTVPDLVPDTEPEPEVVEEELVEISAGPEGPTPSELAQIDLFIEQELYQDAHGVLERLQADYPNDADLVERRRRLDVLEARRKAPPVKRDVEVPRPGPVKSPESPDELFGEESGDEYIDLAKELELELAEEEAMVEEATGRGKGEAMLDEVFREFQRGVAEQLSDDDSDTHFNLGIAYKEMGLLEEAIGEFTVASHDPAFFVEACTMIGVCCNDLGRHSEAAEWYQKALVAPELSTEARTALRYELASALEKTGEIDQALGLFEEIRAHDPSYRDVTERLSSLAQQQRQIN